MDIEPEIVEVDELKLAGPAVVFKGESGKEDDKESDKLWGQTGYYGRVTSIKSRVNQAEGYGMCLKNTLDQVSTIYMAGVRVDDFSEIPVGTFAVVLPASTYAKFVLRGPIAELGRLKSYARRTWFPSSKYNIKHPYWFEVYGKQFKGMDPSSELDLYYPIVA